MKKIGYILTLGLGFLMMACTDKNPAIDPTVDPTDTTEVGTDTTNYVYIVYDGSNATVTVPQSLASYLTVTQSGAHVSIVQSDKVTQEITYHLSGTSTDGGFYTEGSTKATLELNNLTLTNKSATYSGAAIQSGVTASGTAIFNSYAYYPATVSGGSNVTLSNYSSGGGMGW